MRCPCLVALDMMDHKAGIFIRHKRCEGGKTDKETATNVQSRLETTVFIYFPLLGVITLVLILLCVIFVFVCWAESLDVVQGKISQSIRSIVKINFVK